MDLTTLSLDEWSDALPSSGFEVFHTAPALEVIDDHTDAELRLYAGKKGDQVVGLYPAFIKNRTVGKTALSPPPGMSIPRLGPLLMPASPKRRKREQVNAAFTELLLDELGVEDSLTLFRTSCPTDFSDPRQFVWSDLSLDTSFTYLLDIPDRDPADDLLGSFSKSLRREIRDARSLDVTVTKSPTDGASEVFESVQDRYAEQDRGFPLTWEYVDDLTTALAAEDRCRTYVVRGPDGEHLSGIIALYSNDAAYYWLGGSRETYDGTSVNGLVHWHLIRDIADGNPLPSVGTYDLMGANTERICRYKSKFGASLVPYYTLESEGRGMDAAKAAYRLVNR
jgi:hypothetical protein